MKSRFIASLAVGGFVLATATGCGMAAQQATTLFYNASDGVAVPDVEGSTLSVRNAMVIADQDGAEGNLVAALVNSGDEDVRLSLDWETGNAAVTVAAGETMSLGATDEPMLVTGLDTKPGAWIEMYVQSGAGEGQVVDIPVLDNCLAEYAELAPNDDPADRSHCEKGESPRDAAH